MTTYRKLRPIIKLINNSLIDMPAPPNISIWWNFGSLLGFCLITQLITGVFLAIHYTANVTTAFNSVSHIMRDVEYGWLIRTIHATGATIFFISIYMHIGRGIYYGSYLHKNVWNIGVILLLAVIATAFVGYVLPWGQISFWGATVITNLLSAAPYIGPILVKWLWGGFAVDNATLTRFFTFHFILPFIICALVLIHVIFLHETGSSNPLGLKSSIEKVPFHPYFTYKDLVGISLALTILLLFTLFAPQVFSDPENYSQADPLTTPPHIKPEWYFLFAYAILRSIPNKLGGVIALLLSILILYLLPLLHTSKHRSMTFRPLSQVTYWLWISNTILLTWIGGQPVDEPYTTLGLISSGAYFIIIFPMIPLISTIENRLAHL